MSQGTFQIKYAEMQTIKAASGFATEGPLPHLTKEAQAANPAGFSNKL